MTEPVFPLRPTRRYKAWRWLAVGLAVAGLAAAGAWWGASRVPTPTEAPEAQRILAAQADMPFQILIPAYLPKGFDRLHTEIAVNQSGPGGEAMVQLTYRTRRGGTLFIREWVPVNPDKEVLASSRPIQTKWGQGWFLRQGEGLQAIWVDIGPLRASIYTTNQQLLPQDHLLAVADSMGPASNQQVFSFVLNPPQMRAVEPPPPVEATVDAQGVQHIDLIVTPGGYSPLRFAVQRGRPVKLTFRQLGRVGCGNELNLPTNPNDTLALRLDTPSETETVRFTPDVAGEYTFFCAHAMYRGLMTVRE